MRLEIDLNGRQINFSKNQYIKIRIKEWTEIKWKKIKIKKNII